MNLRIPKADPDKPFKDQGPAWLENDGSFKPLIICKCGMVRHVKNHTLSAAGELRASFLCEPGCGFHEFLDLEGYSGPAFEAGQP